MLGSTKQTPCKKAKPQRTAGSTPFVRSPKEVHALLEMTGHGWRWNHDGLVMVAVSLLLTVAILGAVGVGMLSAVGFVLSTPNMFAVCIFLRLVWKGLSEPAPSLRWQGHIRARHSR